MRIGRIEIARFGVWQQLSLRVSARGVSVFYGPNEAGKTSLLRFVRSVLYGFEPFGVEQSRVPARPTCDGVLHVERDGRQFEIRRVSERGSGGLVTVVGTDRQEPAEALLCELRHHTDRRMFENVFAIGLAEMQELGTLQNDEIARHVYGMTLGPTGRRLLDAASALDNRRLALFDGETRSGRLPEILERERVLDEEIALHAPLREEHAEMCMRRARLEERIAELKNDQLDQQQQLAGHRALERVWPVWNQVREYRSDVDATPEIIGFPKSGVERLKRIEEEIEQACGALRALTETARSLREKLRGLGGRDGLERHADELAGFVGQAGWFADASRRAVESRELSHQLKEELDQSLTAVGSDWTVMRIESFDAGPAAFRLLRSAAERYRSAVRRRRGAIRLQKRLSRSVRRESALLEERTKQLSGCSIDDAIAEQSTRMERVQQLARLRLRETGLASRLDGLASGDQAAGRTQLPAWANPFLGGLAVVGALVGLMGFIHATINFEVIAGLSLALIGLSGLFIAWGLKHHAEIDAKRSIGRRKAERDCFLAELRQVRASIRLAAGSERTAPLPAAEAANRPTPVSVDVDVAAGSDDGEILLHATRRLAELEDWKQRQVGILERRRRLSELRARCQIVQRELSAERQNWCAVLNRLGMAETVRIAEALDAWHRVALARDRWHAWQAATDHHERSERVLESFVARMAEAARRAAWVWREGQAPLEALSEWESRLKLRAQVRDERRRAGRGLRETRRKADRARWKVRTLRAKRATLFVKGGAADRDEFIERARQVARRAELEGLLELAESDLQSVSADESELAIVEEDLEAFDAEANRRRIHSLSAEVDQMDAALHAAYEELGSLKQSIKDREADREASSLRFAQAQVRFELKGATEEWLAVDSARRALERVRSNFERNCQPAVLALASGYLERLTRGRYRNVWTPLGQRQLLIDDDRGGTLSVDRLSGGTREQLFLAVRMAMIRELSRRGIEMPMILDDVLVNFDQVRTEAAIDALLEFAEENQQILFFTCHLHLAHMFEARGIEPTWLPGHNLPNEERRAG